FTGGGVEITLTAGARSSIFKLYVAPGPYTRSIVDIDLHGSFSGSWGGGGGDYMPLLRQFFGQTQSVATSSSVDFIMAQTGFDLNLWHPSYAGHRLGNLALPPAAST